MIRIAFKSLVLTSALTLLAGGAVAQTDTLAKIKEAKSIVVGVRDASGAMSFTLGPGKYTGFQVEVCEHIIANIEKAIGVSKIDVRYQLVTAQNRIPLVQNGTVDIECGTTTNNLARQKDVAFAPALFIEGVRFAVKTASGINASSQLAGKTVAATTGTTAVQALRRFKRDVDVGEVLGKDNADAFLLLESDRATAFVGDGQVVATLISRSKNPSQFKMLDQVLSVEPIAIMYRKDDPAFKKVVDDTVIALAKSGEAAKIYDKWFMQPIPPHNVPVGLPASSATQAAWANPSDKPMESYEAR